MGPGARAPGPVLLVQAASGRSGILGFSRFFPHFSLSGLTGHAVEFREIAPD
jgi:hypothetical protein